MSDVQVERVLDAKEAKKWLGQPVLDTLPHGSFFLPSPELGEPTYVRDGDKTLAIVTKLHPDWRAALRDAVRSTEMQSTARTGANMGRNLGGTSRTFGWQERRIMTGRESCRATTMAVEHPEQHAVLEGLAGHLSRTFEQLHPQQARDDWSTVTGAVAPEWRMADDTIFTSGVINKSFQLPYHYDSQNFDSWSAMPTLRRGVRGGHLHLPEYGFAFPCEDGDVVWFCGRRLLHGVTPMTTPPLAKRVGGSEPYRFSVVFYSLRGFKDCATHAVEMGEAAKRRTQREREMAKRIKEEQA